MKKRLFASVGLSLLALNVFGSAAHATENTKQPLILSEFVKEGIQSDVDVQFKGGPLRLVEASNISFGSVDLGERNRHHDALGTKHYVRVSDTRGTKQGWSLGVSLSSFVGENGHKLRGAQLRLFNADVDSVIYNPHEPSYSSLKEEKPTAPDNNSAYKDKATILSPGGPFQTVMIAKKGQGDGDYDLVYKDGGTGAAKGRNDNVSLFVPIGAAEAQSYKAHLNWVLTNAPA